MKKFLLVSVTVIFLCAALFFSNLTTAKEQKSAMNGVIRLHVRAADDSEKEQALKLKVRDEILKYTCALLKDCNDKDDAKTRIQESLTELKKAGQSVVNSEGFSHTVTVSLGREAFEYREYDGFFLPEGEYDSLIVNIGSGEGKNWWCVVFPAACYMGAADVETDEKKMPECFQFSQKRAKKVTVKFWLWERIKDIFD